MGPDNKRFETGSNPYYLNLNNTAKDYSAGEVTNSQYGLLDVLSKFVIIIDDLVIVPTQTSEDLILIEEKI
jgi:hypothetical protein